MVAAKGCEGCQLESAGGGSCRLLTEDGVGGLKNL